MNKKYSVPFMGKDGAWYLRVVTSTEGEFGELKETSGFLKFADETKAVGAYAKLNDGEATASIGKLIPGSNLHEVIITAVLVEAV